MRIFDPENIGLKHFLFPDSNSVDRASQSGVFTLVVITYYPGIIMTSLKGEDEGWLFIDVINNNYIPVVDLNS